METTDMRAHSWITKARHLRERLPVVLVLAALLGPLAGPGAAHATIRVVASINDLASIAASVGGNDIEVAAVAKPGSDVHRVEALPSYMVRVSRANIYLKVGLGLDQWADAIIDGSRNANLVIVDCSRDIDVLEKPTGKVDASMGDVHPNGNPHYWLDPANGPVIARTIADALGRADPPRAAAYHERAEAFAREAEDAAANYAATMSRFATKNIITYHRSWSYLAHAWGLGVVGNVEPVPGIPPSANHLKKLVDLIRERQVAVLLYEPYFSKDAGEFLARETGVRIIKVSPSCDTPKAGSYLAHFDDIVAAISGSGRTGARSRGGAS